MISDSLSKSYLLKNKKLFIPTVLFVWFVIAIYLLAFYKPHYESSATVLIKDSVITAKYLSADNYMTTSSSSSNPILNTMALLKSEEVSQALWKHLNRHYPNDLKRMNVETFSDWKATFKEGSNFIQSKNPPGTDLIIVSFKWMTPNSTQDGLNIILDAFKEKSLNLNKLEHHERKQYLKEQIDQVYEQLNAVRDKIQQYKKQNNIADIGRESMEYTRFRVDSEKELQDALAESLAKKAEIKRLESFLGMDSHQAVNSVALGKNEKLNTLIQKRYALEQEYAMLKSRYTDDNVKVRQVSAQLSQIKNDIDSEVTNTLGEGAGLTNTLVSDEPRSEAIRALILTQADSARLEARANALSHSLSLLDKKIEALPMKENGLSKLLQTEDLLSASLNTLREREIDAELKESQTLSNVFVVKQANTPLNASPPTAKQIALIGFFLGLAAGISVLLLKRKVELLQHRPTPVEQELSILNEVKNGYKHVHAHEIKV